MSLEYFLQASLELAIVFPSALLCFLPVQDHLKVRRRSLAVWGGLLLLAWTALGGAILVRFGWRCNVWLLPSIPFFILLYCCLVDLSPWKTVSVALGVCGVLSCTSNLTTVFFYSSSFVLWSPFPKGIFHNLLCWGVVAAVSHPATHGARELLNSREMPRTWYLFWIMPTSVMGINLYLHSFGFSDSHRDKVIALYVMVSVGLLALLLVIYGLFFLAAQEMIVNMRLHRENDFLQYQVSRYETLRKSIEDSRRAHHDLRQHLKVVQDCVAVGDIAALTDYLEKYGQSIPADTMRSYCGNYAVNAILRYYGEQAEAIGAELEVSFQGGERTVIPEPEFCVLLGNLLENAVEACAGVNGRRYIRVVARQTGDSMLSLTVDNTSVEPPVVENGQLRSTKREGDGTGTESVRIIAERYHGDARFQWRDGMFYASVMLNP